MNSARNFTLLGLGFEALGLIVTEILGFKGYLVGWILDWQFPNCIFVTTFLAEWDIYKTLDRLYLIILSKSIFCPTMTICSEKAGFQTKFVINGIDDPQ